MQYNTRTFLWQNVIFGVALTTGTLAKIRSDEAFSLFWEKCKKAATKLDIGEPVLMRKRMFEKVFHGKDASGNSSLCRRQLLANLPSFYRHCCKLH